MEIPKAEEEKRLRAANRRRLRLPDGNPNNRRGKEVKGIVEAMPLWEDWVSVNKLQKKNLLLLFSLCFNISPFCGLPSRNKQEISKEVMQRRVSLFDNVGPEGTLDDFFKLHGWFYLSQDKATLLVLSFMSVFWFLHLFAITTVPFLNVSESQRSFNNASEGLPWVWCARSGSARIGPRVCDPQNLSQ